MEPKLHLALRSAEYAVRTTHPNMKRQACQIQCHQLAPLIAAGQIPLADACDTMIATLGWQPDGSDQHKEIERLVGLWLKGRSEDRGAVVLIRELAGPRPKYEITKSSAQFVADFVPPDYLLDGILQRRFIYSLTGKTGSGKTAVALLVAASVALSRPLGSREVMGGRVLYFAGENPDDVRMRWIGLSQEMGFDIQTIPVHFVPGRYRISELFETIRREVTTLGGVSLVIVDTSAAYFEGDDENSNVQQGDYARLLRTLVGLVSGPDRLGAFSSGQKCFC